MRKDVEFNALPRRFVFLVILSTTTLNDRNVINKRMEEDCLFLISQFKIFPNRRLGIIGKVVVIWYEQTRQKKQKQRPLKERESGVASNKAKCIALCLINNNSLKDGRRHDDVGSSKLKMKLHSMPIGPRPPTTKRLNYVNLETTTEVTNRVQYFNVNKRRRWFCRKKEDGDDKSKTFAVEFEPNNTKGRRRRAEKRPLTCGASCRNCLFSSFLTRHSTRTRLNSLRVLSSATVENDN